MDWLRKNYDQVALGAAILVLLVSSFAIFRNATEFANQFAELQVRPPQHPPSPPGLAKQVEAAGHNLRKPPQWTFSGRSGLFVPEKHFIDAATGQPATLQTTEVHPPVPNDWFEQFGLSVADADALEQDPDSDGFSNLEEWQGHTNPTDANSHPDYLTKLKLKSFKQEPFPLVFASRTGDTFGINTVDLTEPTQFLKVGDTIAGTRFQIVGFREKTAKDRFGTDVDVSELELENTGTHEQLTLTKGVVATSPASLATFVYTWKERREFTVKKDQEFSLPPQSGIRYKLADVQPTKAVIVSAEHPDTPIEVGPLTP